MAQSGNFQILNLEHTHACTDTCLASYAQAQLNVYKLAAPTYKPALSAICMPGWSHGRLDQNTGPLLSCLAAAKMQAALQQQPMQAPPVLRLSASASCMTAGSIGSVVLWRSHTPFMGWASALEHSSLGMSTVPYALSAAANACAPNPASFC
jgi:hypothetical protein